MKVPLLSLALLAAPLLPLTFAQEHAVLADPLPAALVKMQGSWTGAEKGQPGECRLTVTGSTMHFEGAEKREWYKAVVLLTPDAEPAQLSAKITDCADPSFNGKTALAIFKLENGVLTLVGHPPGTATAPKGFEGDAESRTFTFHRAK